MLGCPSLAYFATAPFGKEYNKNMCGRYGLYDISESNILKENFGYEFKPNFNVAPTQSMPVIFGREGKQTAAIMQWGINRKIGPDIEKSIFNTRADKAFGRFWNKTVLSNRCLVPANGFYEWQRSGSEKIPFWIHEKQSGLMYFAGIYDQDSEGNLHYSIITTTPNQEMAQIHDRMPVILNDERRGLWLELKSESDFLEELLKPLPDGSLEMYEVSREVNIVRNNKGELILPLNSA